MTYGLGADRAPGLSSARQKPSASSLPRPVSTTKTKRSLISKPKHGFHRLATVGSAPGYAAPCCARLCKSVASSTLTVGDPDHGPFTDMHHGLAMTNPCRTSSRRPPNAGSILACRCGLDLASIRVRAGEAFMRSTELAMLLSGQCGPLRPWFVVNPGEGTAAPRAYWLQPSGANNFPCAARIPRPANSCASRSSTALRPPAVRPAHPPPTGSQQGRDGRALG